MICRHGDNESDIFFSCQFGNNYYGKKGKVCILFGFGDGSSGTGCGDGDGLGTRAFDDPEIHVGSPLKNFLVSYLKLHRRPRTRPPCRPAKLAVARSLKFWMQL
jgi:hypothetical protein